MFYSDGLTLQATLALSVAWSYASFLPKEQRGDQLHSLEPQWACLLSEWQVAEGVCVCVLLAAGRNLRRFVFGGGSDCFCS